MVQVASRRFVRGLFAAGSNFSWCGRARSGVPFSTIVRARRTAWRYASTQIVIDAWRPICHHASMHFQVLGEITHAETFAVGSGIREIARLRKLYGKGRWRKRKGIARIRLGDGSVFLAEIHWYEATGIGKRELKIKRLIEGYWLWLAHLGI
jgi:hypothetical protein